MKFIRNSLLIKNYRLNHWKTVFIQNKKPSNVTIIQNRASLGRVSKGDSCSSVYIDNLVCIG